MTTTLRPTAPSQLSQVRIVRKMDIVYIRAEDVAEMIRNVAYSEETDVRDRLLEFANNIYDPTYED